VKRIYFSVSNDLNHDQRMQRICTSLAENGYHVILTGRKKKDSKKLTNQPFRQVRLKYIFEKGKLFYIFMNCRLFWYLLFHSFDIVCAIDLDTFPGAWLAARIKRKKIFYDAHEYFSEVPELIDRPFIKKIWKRIEAFAIRHADKRYTVSKSLADEFFKTYKQSFELIRNMPLSQKALIEHKQEQYLIYQGALNRGRGLEALIESMKDFDIILLLAGDGDLTDRLKQQVINSGLQKKVRFLGNLNPDELRTFTLKGKIAFNLLENTSLNYYYSLANKFFDYVHAGIPQISMNFPEYREMNQKFEVALLIDDIQTDQIKAAINSLLDNPDYYDKLVKNCKAAAQVWNWNNEHKKLLKIYENA